jgi:polyhydroxyalkanoate synthesis regulator phasin
MTPKEKAQELVDTYSYACLLTTDGGKVAASIAVDEIIKERYFHNEHYEQNSKLKYHIEIELSERLEATRKYWNEVKHEIETI